MPSKRKLDSARANGAKSHGPVTPEGRKKSSMNALKHGLNARTVILPNEDDDEYNFQLEAYVEQLQPAGLVEMDLVVEMVNARWRQRRCNKTETGLFAEQMVKQKESSKQPTIPIPKPSNTPPPSAPSPITAIWPTSTARNPISNGLTPMHSATYCASNSFAHQKNTVQNERQ